MTDALEPIAGDAAGQSPATTTLSPDAPRLPEAVPSEAAAPAPAEAQPVADQSAVEPDVPTTPENSRAPVGFFVLMLLIVGAVAAIVAIVRPWESSAEDPPTSVVDEPATTVRATTSASTTPSTTATTLAVIGDAASTTTIVVGALPEPVVTTGVDAAQTEYSPELLELCQGERNALSRSVQAHFGRSTEPPTDLDSLIADGLLEEPPDGWSSRWEVRTSSFGTAVFPVAGSECDL